MNDTETIDIECPFCKSKTLVHEVNGFWSGRCTNGCFDTIEFNSKECAIEFLNRLEPESDLVMHEGSPSCSFCHGENDYNAKFCQWCGHEFANRKSENIDE